MFFIFSLFLFSSIFTTGISDNKVPDLPEDFFRKWENSQVFIYYKTLDFHRKESKYPYPDCFGNLLTATYVLTASSCFMDVKRFAKLLKLERDPLFLDYKDEILSIAMEETLKSKIEKVFVAKVQIFKRGFFWDHLYLIHIYFED